ncbi:organoarsenical effux MFS transporter ArsJ [Enterovibrio makurazakiensis]|uniref:Organoarsenical effux MFS transporter ArsJ n=1 Tax=Enterovibrio gelatinilyticus TaxID=2899819 RepID=A0ABT5R1Z0_9GAMM|nr:organoarsenical effux MFS transporter ArsJ [Enterovibrio sp. ZSDZ42]MDD1794039.1 organoarsenical effux MFS transporter ArsJ [Enterovibrio sp. ZSDZ42]
MALASLSSELKQYLIVTGNYWAFTLTDGALRMLVVLHFHSLGYSPLDIALLFLFYELFGVVTNLVGGWLGAHIGLNRTMNIGLGLQILALGMLLVPTTLLSVGWVMAAQAVSGIAKDLNKMSAKSAVKTLVPANAEGKLYQWVAVLTGSKNALKGAGFFLGGALLSLFGFQGAVGLMAAMLTIVWISSLFFLHADIGQAKNKPKFTQLFSKSAPINVLSAARMCLFGARDVWFVVALPVFLASQLGWNHWYVGGFLACWVIGYGIVQGFAPSITGKASGKVPDGRVAMIWAGMLTVIPALIALALANGIAPIFSVVIGLLVFGGIFAVNSSLHSYLIVSYAREDGVSLDVGFYYMANAMGRLLGTLLSGWIYQEHGLVACLWASSILLAIACTVSYWLPTGSQNVSSSSSRL